MGPVFIALVALVGSTFQTRSAMQAEIAALRHQLAVLQRSAPRRLHLQQSDRVLWILLSRLWPDWRHWLRILKPDTVVRWHRRGFARYWTWRSRRRPGRPCVASAIRDLIQQMCQANFLWGAPRIHGEILKLGIEVAPSTVGKYLKELWLSKTSKYLSGSHLYCFHKTSSDAHFSHDTPRCSACHLPLARCPRTRELGFAPSNRRAV